ncbi:MAG: ATP-binding protein [Dehalogenimonas sp.]|uniref:histidine kinase n=1 Tax=Candidatus Dehalogenimonas loeffleri TaxID=3127115 RepID=A0ABZ2J5P4_9CHLR|nr:ATP-binding protein [Dehalogenimonas sp.]
MSVKLKLTGLYSVVLLSTLVIMSIASSLMLSFGLVSNLNNSLAEDIIEALNTLSTIPSDEYPQALAELEDKSVSSFFVYDLNSKSLIGDSPSNTVIQETLRGITDWQTGINSHSMNSVDGQSRLYLISLTPGSDKLVVVARDTAYIQAALKTYRNILFMTLPGALIIAAIAGWVLANSSLRQVRVITDTAEKIDPAKLEERIPVKHRDELGRLSGTLNALFDRIHGFIQRQHRFTADASHDLTAPLTGIRSSAEVALMKERTPEEYRQSLENIIGRTDKMQAIVDDLMTLAGLDAGPRPAKSAELELSKLAEEAVNRWQAPAANEDIELTAEIKPGVSIFGEPEQFDRLLDNLLSNAVKYTPPGGKVNLTLAQQDGEIIIRVTDTGIGISPEHLPHLGERFYRIDRRVEGTGLGLSIVQGTAQIYRGGMEVESAPGEGSTFRIILPDGSGS